MGTRETRKDVFDTLRKIAFAVSRACETSTSLDRAYDRLRDTIIANEKEHRAFGVRLVGPDAVKGRFTMAQAADYFVARTMLDAAKHDPENRPISTLCGLREDYVQAALIFADPEFRTRLEKHLTAEFPENEAHSALSYVATIDYVDLVEGKASR